MDRRNIVTFKRKCFIAIAAIALIMVLLPTELTVKGQENIDNVAVNSSYNTTVIPTQTADKPDVGPEAAIAIAGLIAVAFIVLKQQK